MKASQLIEELKTLIEYHGDLEVEVNDWLRENDFEITQITDDDSALYKNERVFVIS